VPVRPGRSDCWNAASLRGQVALEIGRVPAHPDDHPGDHPDRHQRDHRLELLLLALREVLLGHVQGPGGASTEEQRDQHPEPHPPQRVAPALLRQERGDDPDDQRGFEALPQADDEGRKHERKVRNPLAAVQVNLP
jgi:hypothetical protein